MELSICTQRRLSFKGKTTKESALPTMMTRGLLHSIKKEIKRHRSKKFQFSTRKLFTAYLARILRS